MKVSTKGRYALRLMLDLAIYNTGDPVALKDIARRQDISEKYLEQIISMLGKAGLVTGSRGTNGGYKLSKKPGEYTAGEVLRVMEGELSPRGTSENNHLESQGNDFFWNEFAENIVRIIKGEKIGTIVK